MAQQLIAPGRLAQRTAGAIANANFTELFIRHIRTPLYGTTANTTFVVPAGYMIEHMSFQNTTANAVTGGVRIGTTSGGADVLAAQTVAANAIDMVKSADFLKRIFSRSTDTTVYLQAVTSWNSASVDFSVIIRRMY